MLTRFSKTCGVVVVVMVITGVVSCHLVDRDHQNPTSPAGGDKNPVASPGPLPSMWVYSTALQAPTPSPVTANYAQMETFWAIVMINGELHQINAAISDQSSYGYGHWFYLEMNEQQGTGKAPGVDQVPVSLQNVVLTFSGLPAELTEFVVAVKEHADAVDYRELERYAVQDGVVRIPVSWSDLVRCFGVTHYSVWLKPIGKRVGVVCGQLDITGTADGQAVILSKAVCFGVPPPPPPPPAPGPPPCIAYITQIGPGHGTHKDAPAQGTFTLPYTGGFGPYPDLFVWGFCGGPYAGVVINVTAVGGIVVDWFSTSDGGVTWNLIASGYPVGWDSLFAICNPTANDGHAICM